jgi:hypothetical protein
MNSIKLVSLILQFFRRKNGEFSSLAEYFLETPHNLHSSGTFSQETISLSSHWRAFANNNLKMLLLLLLL